MAMTNSGLSAKIKSEIEAVYGSPTGSFGTQKLQDFCDALGAAVVEYLKANMEVNVVANDLTITPSGLSVSGSSVSGSDSNIAGNLPAGRVL